MREERHGGPQHRLHNSGPSTREVFRTPQLGRCRTFDLEAALNGWEHWNGRKPWSKVPFFDGGRVTEPAANAALASALEALGVSVAKRPATSGLLVALLKEVRMRSFTRGLVGIARVIQDMHAWDASGPARLTPKEFALTLAAHSVFAPPILLWSRPPSLDWWREDTRIELRVLNTRRHQAGEIT